MKTLAVLLLSFSSFVASFAQQPDSLNMKTQPKGGMGALQIVYYRIDFTREETDYLRTHEAELIFSVSDKGVAKLEKVNDIEMQSVVDSMMRVNDRLPEFYPERVNGRAETGVYFLKLAWPNYQRQISSVNVPFPYLTYYNTYSRKLNEFSEIKYRGPRYDMFVGVITPRFDGNISQSIERGWGTRFDFIFYNSKGWGGGFGSTFVLGKQAIMDPSRPIRTQSGTHIVTFFSGIFGKLLPETKAGQLAIQVEPAFGMTDIVGTDQTRFLGMGFSPGATLAYMLPLGPGRMSRQYFLPTAYRQYLNFHVTARQLVFNATGSRGTVYEFGLSWRLASRPVMESKLKNSSDTN